MTRQITMILLVLCSTVISPTMAAAEQTSAPKLQSMETTNPDDIERFAKYAARKFAEVDYRDLQGKLKDIQSIATTQLFEQYSLLWAKDTANYRELTQKQIVSDPKKMGKVLHRKEPFMYTYMVPIESVVSSTQGSHRRQQTLQLVIVKTAQGLRVAKFSLARKGA